MYNKINYKIPYFKAFFNYNNTFSIFKSLYFKRILTSNMAFCTLSNLSIYKMKMHLFKRILKHTVSNVFFKSKDISRHFFPYFPI